MSNFEQFHFKPYINEALMKSVRVVIHVKYGTEGSELHTPFFFIIRNG